MNAQDRAEKLKQEDRYRKAYHHANTALAVKALPLRKASVEQQHLRSFVAAGLELAKVCEQPQSDKSPLEVLFWLKERLQSESNKPCRNCLYRAACRKEIKTVRRSMHEFCNSFGKGNVVPLMAH